MTNIGQRADPPTEDIDLETLDVEVTPLPVGVPTDSSHNEWPRRTSVPPPPPPAALRSRPLSPAPPNPSRPPGTTGTFSSVPPASAVFPRVDAGRPSPIPAATTPPNPEAEAALAELEKLRKRMRERDAYLAELEAVYQQRSESLRKAEAKISDLRAQLDTQTTRIAELERASQLPPIAAAPEFDDLTRIRGIGPGYARALLALGVRSFASIAIWTPEDIATVSQKLRIKGGRIERERWIEQARALLSGAQ